ncbi:MAG: DUF2179 domain-containing protein [Xanthomonadales bacterium]|nr:DUF2179 domain-containing protein [Xanthomonadales bacterium]
MNLVHDFPLLLALGIFLARIADVSMGTVRILVGFRGYRLLAAAIGFCEAAIWVVAASKVIQHLDAWYLVVAYAGGFAAGNYLGLTLERRLAVGRELARIISYRPDSALAQELTRRGWPVVELHGTRRNHEPVEVMYVVAARRRMPELLALVRQFDPEALYTITDVKSCHGEEPGSAAIEVEQALALRSKRK